MNTLVSIIIPVYNVERYLEEAVKSVCEQTYKNLEIILVNDGSTDTSGIICNNLALEDNRIKVIHKKNGGLSSARNSGIDNALGNYVFFLDGDDFIEIKSIEILLKHFTDKNIGIVSAPCFYSYQNGERNIFKENWNIKENRIIQPEDFCINTLTQKTCFSACCKLYRKDLLDKVRFRIGKRNEDTLFMFDLSNIMVKENLHMFEVSDKLYYYRVNVGSITRNVAFPIQIDYIENLKDMMNESTNIRINNCIKSIYYNEIISFKSYILVNENFTKGINKTALQKFTNHYNNLLLKDLTSYATFKNIIKYILINKLSYLYKLAYKIKNLI